MNKSITLQRNTPLYKTIAALLGIGAAIALPQVFHALGVLSGTGAQIGTALLPMHLPVLLAGFFGGPVAGCIAGILSPVLSYGISGMPAAALVPFMMAELGTYGLTAGLLSKVRMNSFVKLLIAQLAGRAVRMLAVLAASLFGGTALTIGALTGFVTAGLFGIVLQWAILPLLLDRFGEKPNA